MNLKKAFSENIKFILLLSITTFLMLISIVWVYHFKVLNAPKVYSDGFGYYVYLPAITHGDFTFSFTEGWEHPLGLKQVEGGMINKYPVGTAIMEAPFFLMAHIICLLKDTLTGSYTATGYSNLYQYAILIAGIFYWAVGTTFLYRLLTKYLGFSKNVSVIVCGLITYATNLFHYASYDACFSHIYSYALFNTFLLYLCWYEKREAEGKNRIAHTCLFGVLAGLIFMVRNTNIVFVITYILYGVKSFSSLKQRLLTVLKPKRAIPIILTGFATLLPQLCYWHAATGHWFVYSYGNDEPFYWLRPALGNFLFSIRKGLFFWCPFLLLAVVGMIYAYRRRQQLYTGLVCFLVLIIYISSAWWCWYYGGAFGQRVSVDFLGVFAIFIAYLFSYLEQEKKGVKTVRYRVSKAAIVVYSAGCVLWNLICMLAYWYRVLPSDGATWEHVGNIVKWVTGRL